jgi:glucose/arabinose dehydrogenase
MSSRFNTASVKMLNDFLIDPPTALDTVHNGAKILVGPDNNAYLTIGDLTHENKRDSPVIT